MTQNELQNKVVPSQARPSLMHWIGRVKLSFSKSDLVVLALSILAGSNLYLWSELVAAKRASSIVTVEVQPTYKRYKEMILASAVSNDDVGYKTQNFLNLAQEEVDRVVTAHPGRLVLAKECVLGGGGEDATPGFVAALDRRYIPLLLASRAPGLGGGASAGGSGVAPASGPQALPEPSSPVDPNAVKAFIARGLGR